MNERKKEKVLITGGNGFIGSYLAIRLKEMGYEVLIADSTPTPSQMHGCEQRVGNLCDPTFCLQVVRGVDAVFHFAANMGGMGAIHQTNDFSIYRDNDAMSVSLLEAAIMAGAKSFFYASSACVYPNSMQSDPSGSTALREDDVGEPPEPQGLYGLQKLNIEHMLNVLRGKIQVFIARFHNIYGPYGAWNNGREKAPAALLRKALAIQELRSLVPAHDVSKMEIWGDGSQRRSFLFIDDCVDAIVALWQSHWHHPLNIGSDSCLSISDLAIMALKVAGEQDTSFNQLDFIGDGPVGVASRNSDNRLAYEHLGGWRPKTNLEQGLRLMKPWMEQNIQEYLSRQPRREEALRKLCSSSILNMQSDKISFAILLPVTSRKVALSDLFQNLRIFAQSLKDTTWRNTHEIGAIEQYAFKVYIAIDEDDSLLNNANEPVKQILQENIAEVEQIVCNTNPGHVCELWRITARKAYDDGNHYFILMGDDIEIQDCDWMSRVHSEFRHFHETRNVPFGFGCVAFTDTSFPGMPTFPVVHRKHLEIFGLDVVPNIFINQDGDPYLFQLYRRWGCSSMIEKRLKNRIGGSNEARYSKKPVPWTYDTLSNSVNIVENWLVQQACEAQKLLTLDVVVPSYRVDLTILDRIIALKPSDDCSVMYIVIIDDPTSYAGLALERSEYTRRPDVRIRTNKSNLGASASRNRGLKESSAEWVIFLDDDVQPDTDLLVQAERVIRNHPTAAGFVGTTVFPPADTIFKSAVHLAGVTYFWDIANKLSGPAAADVPWGVTANLIARRDYNDGVYFDLRFPKTGGGEDIAFCRNKRDKNMERGAGYGGFHVAPEVRATHPWWANGARSYWRFYMWSKGDGALVKMFPHLTYWDYAPNSAESLLLALISIVAGSALLPVWPEGAVHFVQIGTAFTFSVLLSNFVHDWYRHLFRDRERAAQLDITLDGVFWLLAITESTVIRMASEIGRLVGMIERREWAYVGKRFDWFTCQCGDGPRQEERKNNVQRFTLTTLLAALIVQTVWAL